MNPTVSARLESLFPAIQKKAVILAARSNFVLNADDLAQEMALHIARRLEEDPTRLTQKDAYLIGDACQNKAENLLRSERRQSAHIAGEVKIADEPEEDDDTSIVLVFQDTDYTPEQHAEYAEFYKKLADVVSFLSKKDKQIFSLIVDGRRDSEIAKIMGVTPSCVSQRKSHVASFLTAFAK